MSFVKLVVVVSCLFVSQLVSAQNPINWSMEQLMEPAVLPNNINSKKDVPLIINIGPSATIPNSIDVGMVNSAEGLSNLKTALSKVDKKKIVVVYCGCCPYEHCPNVRPAINALKELKFNNYYLLNLPQNIKKDWIDKGYPVAK